MNHKKPYTINVILFIVTFTVSLSVIYSGASESHSYEYWNYSQKREQIIFAGHLYSFHEANESIFERLSLYDPGLFIFGGDNIYSTNEIHQSRLDDSIVGAEEIGAETLLIKGNHDRGGRLFRDKHFGVVDTQDIRHIYLDTTFAGDGGRDGDSCSIDQQQLDFLTEQIEENSKKHIILYVHHALWVVGDFIDENIPVNFKYSCAEKPFWQENMLPIIDGKIDAVISSDGGLYSPYVESDYKGTKYIISGSPLHQRTKGGEDSGGPSLMSFLRITTNEDDLEIGLIDFSDESLSDERYLDDLDTYEVIIDHKDLKDLYQNAPIYDYLDEWKLDDACVLNRNWKDQIEPVAVTEWLQQDIDADVSGREATVNIRGNVGNHWDKHKKSWDVRFEDGRQFKLISPADRRYINQIYAKEVSDWYGVLSPDIRPVRLVINDIDFGVYLEYEDFDKAFIETNGFNSDANPSKNFFRDHFSVYKINESISYTYGDGDNKTYQQNISSGQINSQNFNDYFDQDHYARWLASQIVIGDRHQHESDNFRYFTDKTTGKYIMVSWDPYVSNISSSNIFRPSVFNNMFMENSDNAKLVEGYVNEFVENEAEFRERLEDIRAELEPIFVNDTSAELTRNRIKECIDETIETNNENIPKLKEWINED